MLNNRDRKVKLKHGCGDFYSYKTGGPLHISVRAITMFYAGLVGRLGGWQTGGGVQFEDDW